MSTPGPWSLLPPLVALLLAVGTRRVVPALAAGGLTGTVLLAWQDGRPVLWGLLDFVRIGVLGRISDPGNAQVVVLIVLIGGFVGLLERSGAARALAEAIIARVRSPAQAQLATWVGGLVLFFSDFGNVLILGPVFRPIYDRLGIPREKLAWIIDSTAAPVCVLVPVIAWGVYAVGLIEAAFASQPEAAVAAVLPGAWRAEAGTVDGFATFVRAIPFQLYPLLSLVFVPAMIALGRDRGPMAAVVPRGAAAELDVEPDLGAGPAVAVVPLVVLFVVLVVVGGVTLSTEGRLTGAAVRTGLASAYLCALMASGLLLWRGGHGDHVTPAIYGGMGRTAPLLVLLVLAWTLGEVCKGLGTGAYVAGVVGDGLPAGLLPVVVFGVGATVSFATGTSWGTFAILMPIAVPLSVALGAPALSTIGAVLSGGVFGDHCSPISDTTLLASMGAGTEHARHVSTQLPYALAVGLAAALGFVAAGLTDTAAAGLGVGLIGVVAAVVGSRRAGA